MVEYIPEIGDLVILTFDPQIHVEIESKILTGFIMVEQCKSIDYKTRKIKFVEKVNRKTLDEVLGILSSIVDWA